MKRTTRISCSYLSSTPKLAAIGTVANMAAAGDALTRTRGRSLAVLLLFLVSPLSSAQLFEAAGLMEKIRLRPLLIAFGVGRTVSYRVLVVGLVALGNIDWAAWNHGRNHGEKEAN